MTEQQANGKAAVYLRVSTREQAEEGISLAMQEQVCREAATQAGASSVEVFRDEGFTGMKLDRPGLNDLRNRLPEFSSLYVFKTDRLARRLLDRLQLMEQLIDAGIAIHSTTERLDLDTIQGRAMVNMMGVFAELEVEQTRERVRAALKHRATVANLPLGRPPYGYMKAGDDGAFIPDPAEAPVVVELYRRFAAGDSLMSLVRWLNSKGLPCKQGADLWSARTVQGILRNRSYLGQHFYHGEAYPSGHPPIVTEELWGAVAERHALRRKLYQRGRYTKTLSPLLRCGVCGSTLSHTGKDWPRYVCNRNPRLPKDQRHQETVSVTSGKVEAAIWNAVAWLANEETFREALALTARRRVRKPQVSAWERRVVEIDRLLAYNLRAAGAGAVDVEVLAETNAPLLAEKANLRDKLERAAQGPEQDGVLRELKQRSMGEFLEALPELSAEKQLAFLLKIFSRGELYPQRLCLHLAHPDLPTVVCELPNYYAPRRGGRLPEPCFE